MIHSSKQWGNGKLIGEMCGAALEERSRRGPYLSKRGCETEVGQGVLAHPH